MENPRIACELLLARLLNCKRLDLTLRFDQEGRDTFLEAMRRGIKRVADSEPVQYVVGQTEFMGHVLTVDRRALIPRPETEGLVETVRNCEALWSASSEDGSASRPIVVDVGTGTGCISIALALAEPRGIYIGLDVSPEALALAGENAMALGLDQKVAFVQGELADCVEPETVSAIVSNPPYIPTEEYHRLPDHIRKHEPRLALEAGENGLSVIEPLVQDSTFALVPGGFLFLEIGSDQAGAVSKLMQSAGFKDLVVRQDLAGHDRVVHGRLTEG